ncbi:MAG TPA: hypothetical protein PLU53_07785 [Bacteroidia bacterium]|nr:hypothetical protein [Bacteroidia bacterium]
MKNTIIIFGLFIALLSCQSGSVPEGNQTISPALDLKTSIIGRWDTNYVLVAMKSINNSGLDGTMEVLPHSSTGFSGKVNVQSVFREDGTYLSEYRDANKKLVIKSSGKWSAQGKTLILKEEFPETRTL